MLHQIIKANLKQLVLLQVVLFCLIPAACGSGGPTIEEPLFTTPSDTRTIISPQNEIPIVPWHETSEYIGQYVIVTGTVVLTYYAEDSNGKPTFLNFHDPYEGHFTCVIWGDDREYFPDEPESYYLNHHVQVRGFITEYKGSPEMILGDESQIRLTVSSEP